MSEPSNIWKYTSTFVYIHVNLLLFLIGAHPSEFAGYCQQAHHCQPPLIAFLWQQPPLRVYDTQVSIGHYAITLRLYRTTCKDSLNSARVCIPVILSDVHNSMYV